MGVILKKGSFVVFRVPLSDCQCVCERDETKKKKQEPVPTLKNPICRTEQQNVQAQKHTPITDVAVHYVATYTHVAF